ncbi:MAG: NUDIX hydrolase [Flavobacteriales bacterium]
MSIQRFNVRAYFIIYNDLEEVLVSDELIAGKKYTKFPGGGVEFGEGIEDAIRREALEELGQEVEIIQHIYTTGFFVQSKFNPSDQVISVYYLVQLLEPPKFKIATKKFDFDTDNHQTESFRWAPLHSMHQNELSFPADRHLLALIQESE